MWFKFGDFLFLASVLVYASLPVIVPAFLLGLLVGSL